MIKITSLGGSGEDSRNCFLMQSSERTVLLDCGVRREIAEVSRVYPLLTAEIAESLDAVIISHAHEDHTASLPYLYELGYHGPVYAAGETVEMIPSFLRKWADYVRENGGTLPFREENIGKLRFESINKLPFPVQYGRDGHVVGGLWFRFETEGHSILYTGDLTYDSLLLEADPLPEADILIIDSAYAGRKLDQAEQYEKLRETAQTVTAGGGKLLLPVPANGRGIDMFVYLSRFKLPLFVENNIIKNTIALRKAVDWIKPFAMSEDRFTLVTDANRGEILKADCPGVFLFGDGMMTSAVSKEYFSAVRTDSRSRILITGHSARGTLANDLLRTEFREQNGIQTEVDPLTIKVHNDEQDVMALVSRVRPDSVMLFHSKAGSCAGLVDQLTARGINAVCDVNTPIILL